MTVDNGIESTITYPVITSTITYPVITSTIEPYIPEPRNEIYTVDDLKKINEDLTADYYLMNDLDLKNEEWTPIGTYAEGFIGTFYGQGHKISNLVIEKNNNSSLGLFGAIGRQIPRASGHLKDLIIDTVYINSTGSQIGSLVGNVLGGSTVIGCAVIDFEVYGTNDIGGLIGEISNEGRASQSYADNGYILALGENAGGFVANNCIEVDNCYSYNCAVAAENGFAGHFGGYCTGKHTNCWSWSPNWLTSPDSYAFCGLCDGTKTIDCVAFGSPQDPVGHGINSWEEEDIEYFGDSINPFLLFNYDPEIWRTNVPNGLLLRIFNV